LLSSLSNKAILTKARAMYGKRLTRQDYDELLKKQSVSEIAAYLKNGTHFSEAFASVNEVAIHRGQLENLLHKDLFNRYVQLCHYEYSKENEFYYYLVMEVEVQQILNCARFLDNDLKEQFVLSMPAFLTKFCTFDLNRLMEVSTLDQLFSLLETTRYKVVLTGVRPKQGEHINVTDFEVRLRNFYYKTVFDEINVYFKGKTREELKEIFEIRADLSNVNMIIRFKQFFSASPEYIRSCLVPYSKILSGNVLDRMVHAKSAEEALSVLQARKVGRDSFVNRQDFIENMTDRLKYYFGSQMIRYSVNAPAVLCSFVILSEIEVQNIINIIEGVRYGVAFSEIEKLLII